MTIADGRPTERELAGAVREWYSAIWPPVLEQWTAYLIACREAFDGDLDAMLILAAIGSMTLDAYRLMSPQSPASCGQMSAPDFTGPHPRPINIESVAPYVGMPRETVRRKVRGLISRGRVVREARGALRATSRSAQDLDGLSDRTFRLLARVDAALG